nr:snRNA-activating protein complex subunit 3 isoform X2 [Hydra vulgaris]
MEGFFRSNPILEAEHFSSPLISIPDFKNQFKELLCEDFFPPIILSNEESNKKLGELLNCNQQTIEELEDVCSIENLKCDFEKENFDSKKVRGYEDFPDNSELQIVRLTKQLKTKFEELVYVPNFIEEDLPKEPETSEKIPNDEVLLAVSVYHSQKKLSALRDVIVCTSDNIIYGDFSKNPDLSCAKPVKEFCQSAFFFIEKCFYNDTRNPLNRDYSKIIIEWAKDEERYTVNGLGLFTSAIMENTTFSDLKIRLGYPYLYCHQGNCEHLIVFNDMRMVSKDDPQALQSYPFKVYQAPYKRRKCSVCNIHYAKWRTLNDPLAFDNPSLFCERCFKYLHYTQDGKPLCDFKAFPHVEVEY